QFLIQDRSSKFEIAITMKTQIQNHRDMRCTRRRKHSKIANQTMGVSPEVIFNVNDHSLAVIGHEYLSRNENYIRPNRTALRSYKERVKIVKKEHEIMVN
ncbi:unnamed protein product, partial [Rotaria magnacalcarata]